MKAYAVLKQLTPNAMVEHRFFGSLLDFARGVDVNWYLVAVVAMATFAISMDVMFPPIRMAIGNGVDIYAGHAREPLSISEAVDVDFLGLAVEIAVIAIAGVIGWQVGAHRCDKRG